MLHLYNTLTRKIEKFQPLQDKRAGFYACGPTVYDFAHIGNLRTYLFEDILKRVLLYNGYQVKHVVNLTDVDDKMIKAAAGNKKSLKFIAAKYIQSFKKDIKILNILPPNRFAPATRYIKEMIELVEKLLKNKVAYEKDGSIYFSLKKFPAYGRLAQLKKQELKAGARVDVDNYDKENPADFVLWKKWVPKDGGVFWDTALGKGRPGWHLECSAISTKELGQPFDLHAGAVDLIFPHHENEIAQTEAATGKKLANYWLHGEHLLVEGQKMAKSLNNFFTLRDVEAKGFNPLAFRYLILTAHYRSKLNFTWEALKSAQNGLEHLYNEVYKLQVISCKLQKSNEAVSDKFLEKINDDLDLPGALAVIWDGLKKQQIDYQTLLEFDEIFGLKLKEIGKLGNKKTKIPVEIKRLLVEREKARQNKNWPAADQLRKKIRELGFEIEDTATGFEIKSISSS